MSFAIPIKSDNTMMQQRLHGDFHNTQQSPVAGIVPTAPLPVQMTGANMGQNQQQMVMPGFGGGLPPHLQTQQNDDQHSRWSQYQQLWRQHVYMNGRKFFF